MSARPEAIHQGGMAATAKRIRSSSRARPDTRVAPLTCR